MAGRRLLRERAGLGRSQIGDAAFPMVLLCTVAALGVEGAKASWTTPSGSDELQSRSW